VQVSQDYDSSFLFSTVKIFNWNKKLQYKNDNLFQLDDLQTKRFQAAIRGVLIQRGFLQGSQPDFLVSYTYEVADRLQIDPFDARFGFGYGYSRFGRYSQFGIHSGNSVRQYYQGKLIISIHSAKSAELLWKGTGTCEVFTHSTPEESTRTVNEMVEAVLAQFPPANNP